MQRTFLQINSTDATKKCSRKIDQNIINITKLKKACHRKSTRIAKQQRKTIKHVFKKTIAIQGRKQQKNIEVLTDRLNGLKQTFSTKQQLLTTSHDVEVDMMKLTKRFGFTHQQIADLKNESQQFQV